MNEWLIVGALSILLLICIQLSKTQPPENTANLNNHVIARSLPHSN